jgi:hypothetical protein
LIDNLFALTSQSSRPTAVAPLILKLASSAQAPYGASGTNNMGSTRTINDPAADAAAAEADGDPISIAAAAADQPSSSVHEQQFVNAGMVVAAPWKHTIYLFVHVIRYPCCMQASRDGWNAGGTGHRNPQISSAQQGSGHTRELVLLRNMNLCIKALHFAQTV